MDYNKLTNNEIIEILRDHGLINTDQLPFNWMEQIKTINLSPGILASAALVDLYIADRLNKNKVMVPDDIDLTMIDQKYYVRLADILYLPKEYNDLNINRTRRIIRIIKDIQEEGVVEVVTAIPNKIPDGFKIYQINGELAVCGNKTYRLRNKLKETGGKYNGIVKCWMFPLNKLHDLNNIIKKDIENKNEYIEKQEQLKQKEVEATFIPNIERLPQYIKDNARTYEEQIRLISEMLERDCDELRNQWGDVFRTLEVKDWRVDKYGNAYKVPVMTNIAKVTYDGDVKPPDLAFVCYRNRWSAPQFGYNVQRVGYKEYEVNVHLD